MNQKSEKIFIENHRINTKIKMCGMFREEDIAYANLVKPEYVGFVFAKSRRQVTKEQAAILRHKLHEQIIPVGVFVNESNEQIIDLLKQDIISVAQLHGEETEKDVLEIQNATGKKVIKALKMEGFQTEEFMVEVLKKWNDSSVDFLLVDSGTGSGKTFDWETVKSAIIKSGLNKKVFIAGGLDQLNVEDAKNVFHPYGLDLSSGLETEGIKDLDKMKRVAERIRYE